MTEKRNEDKKQTIHGEKTRLARDFFHEAGQHIFEDYWKESDITCKASPWHISKIRNGGNGEERKSIVQEAILEALADGRVVARLSNDGSHFLTLLVEVWQEHVPERYRKSLPTSPPITKREVKELVEQAMMSSIYADSFIAQLSSTDQSKSDIDNDDDDDDDDGDNDGNNSNTAAEDFSARSERYRKAARSYLTRALEELYWNTPTHITFQISENAWKAMLDDPVKLEDDLRWTRSSVVVSPEDVDPQFEIRENKAKIPLIPRSFGILASRVPQDIFNWDEIHEEAMRRFDRHLYKTGPHEFRIQDPNTALGIVVDQAPWLQVSNWGPSSDIRYQSFWLVLTLATWRILACKRQVTFKHGTLVKELQKFLNQQYDTIKIKVDTSEGTKEVNLHEANANLPSVSVLGKIVRPVLAQFEQQSASGDIFNGFSVEYIKKKFVPSSPANSTKTSLKK